MKISDTPEREEIQAILEKYKGKKVIVRYSLKEGGIKLEKEGIIDSISDYSIAIKTPNSVASLPYRLNLEIEEKPEDKKTKNLETAVKDSF